MRRVVAFAAVLFGMTARAALARDAAAPVAYLVMDADTGTVLAEHEAHKRWPPASMAKMMTVLIAIERVHNHQMSLDEPLRASAWRHNTQSCRAAAPAGGGGGGAAWAARKSISRRASRSRSARC